MKFKNECLNIDCFIQDPISFIQASEVWILKRLKYKTLKVRFKLKLEWDRNFNTLNVKYLNPEIFHTGIGAAKHDMDWFKGGVWHGVGSDWGGLYPHLLKLSYRI